MEPLIYPKDSHLIATMMDVYRELTGTDAQPLAIGGGTYARALSNIVGFGPVFPGDPDVAHKAMSGPPPTSSWPAPPFTGRSLKRLAQ